MIGLTGRIDVANPGCIQQSRGVQMQGEVSPDHILQIGFGFWASKTLLSAVELDLFSRLVDGPKTGPELQGAMGLHPRGTYDFLDTLVALGLLQRTAAAKPANTPIRLRPRGSWSSRAPNTSAAYSKWRTHGCIGSGAISRRP